jgi:ribonuclease HI
MTILNESKNDDSTVQIFTDGSKSEQRVGAGVAIYTAGAHQSSLIYRLHERCTNNQAEQIAILKSLVHINKMHTPDKTVTTFTDSQTTLRSLQNNTIHTSLIEEIGRQFALLRKTAWTIKFSWVKAHAGIQGNELADTLAKAASTNQDIPICYNKLPKTVIKLEIEGTSVDKWQTSWNQTTKGNITKEYFASVTERLNMKISTNQNLSTMLTGQGNINDYLHRFNL